MKKYYLIILLAITFWLFFNSYSKINDNIPIAPAIGTHLNGWIGIASSNFHGKYIYVNKLWNLNTCFHCHGSDYLGGTSGKSCYKCHSASPEDCRLCHGNGITTIYPPKALNGDTSVSSTGVGTHAKHMNPDYSATVLCICCHKQPVSFEDPIHIGSNPDGIAEIVFDSLSQKTTGGITPTPLWERNAKTCSGSYCHGNFVNGTYRLLTNPPNSVWTIPSSVKCGFCHGNPETLNPLPGGTHPSGYTINTCYYCHGSVINSSGIIINKSRHINGLINWN